MHLLDSLLMGSYAILSEFADKFMERTLVGRNSHMSDWHMFSTGGSYRFPAPWKWTRALRLFDTCLSVLAGEGSCQVPAVVDWLPMPTENSTILPWSVVLSLASVSCWCLVFLNDFRTVISMHLFSTIVCLKDHCIISRLCGAMTVSARDVAQTIWGLTFRGFCIEFGHIFLQV